MHRERRRLKVPASLASIDLERVRRVMFKADGNVTRAAKILKVSSADLRRLTWRHPTLVMDALEKAHRMVDKAEEKLRQALDGDHAERSLRASLFILSRSPAARERGWSRHSDPSDGLYSRPPPALPTLVIWASEGSGGYRPLAPNVPEARAAASSLASSEDSEGNGRVH
jgi:hypothetical protein